MRQLSHVRCALLVAAMIASMLALKTALVAIDPVRLNFLFRFFMFSKYQCQLNPAAHRISRSFINRRILSTRRVRRALTDLSSACGPM